jgi:hypothetical protein
LRPGSRGFIGIGCLAVALFSGGIDKPAFRDIISTNRVQTQLSRDAIELQTAFKRPHVAAAIVGKAALQFGREAAQTRELIEYLYPPSPIWVTHYGESYNGYKLGCGIGAYASSNPTIVAVGLEREAEWPCGTLLEICGPGGCQVVSRQDGCPGCGAYVLDLSEAGIARVCGPGAGVCRATVQAVAFCPPARETHPGPAPASLLWPETSPVDLALLLLDEWPERIMPEITAASRGC